MAIQTRAQRTEVEYQLAPWHLRLRWWALARWWGWCHSFEQSGAEAPQQVNPLWWR